MDPDIERLLQDIEVIRVENKTLQEAAFIPCAIDLIVLSMLALLLTKMKRGYPLGGGENLLLMLYVARVCDRVGNDRLLVCT